MVEGGYEMGAVGQCTRAGVWGSPGGTCFAIDSAKESRVTPRIVSLLHVEGGGQDGFPGRNSTERLDVGAAGDNGGPSCAAGPQVKLGSRMVAAARWLSLRIWEGDRTVRADLASKIIQ